MIKFFRRFRKQFLTEKAHGRAGSAGRFSRYLLYAIGEIILVVIGILIALQINTWNEERKSADQEALYLKRLIADNKQDLLTFSGFIKELNIGKQSVELFSAALKSSVVSDSMLIHKANEYFKYGSIFPIFSSSRSTFEDLSSTGNLNVIRNSELRDKIVQHYALHVQLAERIQVATDWTLPLDGPFTLKNNIMKFEPTTAFLFPESSPEALAKELRDSKIDYISNAAAHYWINADAISSFEKLRTLTSLLIEELERELGVAGKS